MNSITPESLFYVLQEYRNNLSIIDTITISKALTEVEYALDLPQKRTNIRRRRR